MLEEAVRAGRREALVALRDVLAGKLEKASPSGAALVAAQLRAVLSELDELPAEKVSKADELAARRRKVETRDGVMDSAGKGS